MKILLTFTLVLTLGWTSSVYSAKKAAGRNNNLEAGKNAFTSGNLERAINLLDKAIRGTKNQHQKSLAYYYHGLALFELGHFYSSYLSFKMALSNPNPAFRKLYGKAIKNAALITDNLNIVDRLGKDLEKFPDSLINAEVADKVNYAKGVYRFTQRDLTGAKGHLKAVHPQSDFYSKAMFYLGVLATQEKDYKEAQYYFKKVVELTTGKKELRDREDLAKLNLARSVYSAGDMEASVERFARFTSSSKYWQTVLLEASWPLMRLNDTTVSLGNLHTLTSPFYREDLVGEAFILRSIILFALCKYEEMRYTLTQFFEIYDPVLAAMEKEQNRLSGSEAYFNAFTNRENLNGSFLRYLDRDTGVQKSKQILGLIETEYVDLAKYNQSKTIGMMRKSIRELEGYSKNKLGKEIQGLHELKLKELVQQREQANYLKVEIITGEKELIEKSKGLPPQRITDVETNVFEGYQYWPFRGEYWEDELGTYVYTTESSCIN